MVLQLCEENDILQYNDRQQCKPTKLLEKNFYINSLFNYTKNCDVSKIRNTDKFRIHGVLFNVQG